MPVISTNGQFVAFLSNATNLTANAVSNGFHIYRRNLQSGTTQLADVDTNGAGSTDDELTSLSLSADGQFVAFNSPDGSLVGGDKNHADDVFVRDLCCRGHGNDFTARSDGDSTGGRWFQRTGSMVSKRQRAVGGVCQRSR